MDRNNFAGLVATIKDLMRTEAYNEDNDNTEKCAKRYYESFMVEEGEAELNPGPVMLDGDCRIEILGEYFEGRGGHQKIGDYNGHFLFWRLRPKDGEKLKAKHMLLHRFSLAKISAVAPGLTKICRFNPDALNFVNKFLADNKKILVDAIRASAAYRVGGMLIQIQQTKASKS